MSANQRIAPFLGRRGSGYPYPLDLFGNAAIAYSVRKLREAYTGPCMKVYKSTDFSIFADIGFVDNYIDTASLLSFAAGGTLHFDWYDQSGNGRHATKISGDTDATRPTIVTSGALSTVNGKAAGHFKNSSRLGFSSITPLSIFLVYTREGARTVEYAIGVSGAAGLITGGSNTGITGLGFVTSSTLRLVNTSENTSQRQGTYIGGSVETVWNEGSNNVTAASSYSDIALDTLGRRDQLALSFWGWHQDIIMYTSDKSSEKAAIESNQMSYFL